MCISDMKYGQNLPFCYQVMVLNNGEKSDLHNTSCHTFSHLAYELLGHDQKCVLICQSDL